MARVFFITVWMDPALC